MFFRTPVILPYFYSTLVWRIPTSDRKIYITFDDGPVAGPTDFALDVLKRYEAKATFFCIGHNISQYPLVYERVIRSGHKVGNHTHDHVNGFFCTARQYYEQVTKCQHKIKDSTLFRPPYGKIRRSQIRALQSYKIIMWDIMTFDFFHFINPERSLKKIIKTTRPGSIIVFHDSYKAEKNMRFILPRYLEYFKQRDVSFETIPEGKTRFVSGQCDINEF